MKSTYPLLRLRKAVSVLAISILVLQAIPAAAQDDVNAEILKQLKELNASVAALNEKVKNQGQEIEALKRENADLKGATAKAEQAAAEATKASAAVAASTPPAAPVQTAVAPSSNALASLNPEIGVVADIVGTNTDSQADEEGNDRISVRELEITLGHDIDPYSRLDSTITFSDFEDPSLEEAYITHWGLPFELGTRLGRVRPKVGKANQVHRDSLETVDEPFVIAEYLGVEGMSRTGSELSRFLPTPSENFAHDLTLGFMEGGVGEDGTLLGDTTRIPTYYTHYRSSYDISDATNFELGGTYLIGSSDDDSADEVHLMATDVTLVHHFNPINRFKLQGEAFFQNRDEPALTNEDDEDETGDSDEGPLGYDATPFGYYVLADYRLTERLGFGGRFDVVEPTNGSEGPRDADVGYTGYLTFYQSEFARWRTQYTHVDFADGGSDNRVFFQGTFAIGVHKHAIQ